MRAWLEGALKKEKEKFDKCPPDHDMDAEYEVTQAWGYVVAGYFLVEQSIKALLHVQGKDVRRKHSLTIPFEQLEDKDKDVLREYYVDYIKTRGWNFRYEKLDDYLTNLDGETNGRDFMGSFGWRYFLVEERGSDAMPFVNVGLLHEIAFGCIRLIDCESRRDYDPTDNPLDYTYGRRLHENRMPKIRDWIAVRKNTHEWIADRLEIICGPDRRERYDWIRFSKDGKHVKSGFGGISDAELKNANDMREEFNSFDPEKGYCGIIIVHS